MLIFGADYLLDSPTGGTLASRPFLPGPLQVPAGFFLF